VHSKARLGAIRYRLEQSGLRAPSGTASCAQANTPRAVLANLRVMLGYVELGAWLGVPEVFQSKNDLFAEACAGMRPRAVPGIRSVSCESLRWWSEHLRDPQARLVGLTASKDCPSPGSPVLKRASSGFRASQRLTMRVSRSRSAGSIGRYRYLCRLRTINSLSTSTATLQQHRHGLQWANAYPAGTLIYFDELPDRNHELLALREHLARSGHEIEPLG